MTSSKYLRMVGAARGKAGSLDPSDPLRLMVRREKIDDSRAEILRGWVHSGFQVSAERRIEAGDRKGLESLRKSQWRGPPFRWKGSRSGPTARCSTGGNFHPGLGTDHRLVTGIEFLALIVPHILPRNQVTSREYGGTIVRGWPAMRVSRTTGTVRTNRAGGGIGILSPRSLISVECGPCKDKTSSGPRPS